MSCVFCNFDDKCDVCADGIEMPGAVDGYCVCDDEDNPLETCESYEPITGEYLILTEEN